MKTREQIYKGEGAALLRILTTYHALHYEQVLQLFDKNRDSIKSLITSLTKQGRIYHDKEQHLLCDTEESANSPDMGTIAAFWVLLDFKKALIYHTSGDFPVKLHFFSHDETYEIIYVANGQEALMNHVFESIPPREALRIIIIESENKRENLRLMVWLPTAWSPLTALSATTKRKRFHEHKYTNHISEITGCGKRDRKAQKHPFCFENYRH